jgi:hypothetical protein
MIDLAQSTSRFSHFPISTTKHISSRRPGLDTEHADENKPQSFEITPPGRPLSEYHMEIDGKPVSSLFSSYALEFPQPVSSSFATRRSTEPFGLDQVPFWSISARENSEEGLPSQSGSHHSAGPVCQFHTWVDTENFQATASPEAVEEMLGEFPRRSLRALSRDPSTSRTEQNRRIQEHARTFQSPNLRSTDPSEMPADFTERDSSVVNFKPPVPPKIAIDQPAEQSSNEPTLGVEEKSSHIISRPHKQPSTSAQTSLPCSRLTDRNFSVSSML